MSRRWSHRAIRRRIEQFSPRPGNSPDYETGYRAALDEVLLSFTPETFFARAETETPNDGSIPSGGL